MCFMPVADPKTVKNRVHLDLTTSAADRDQEIDRLLALRQHLPAKRLGPEPGQARLVVSVNHDVVESYGHVASMRGARDPYLPNRALRRLPIVTQFVFGGRRTVRASFVAGLFGGPAFQIPAAPGEVL